VRGDVRRTPSVLSEVYSGPVGQLVADFTNPVAQSLRVRLRELSVRWHIEAPHPPHYEVQVQTV